MNRYNLTGLASLLLLALGAAVFAPEIQGAPSDQAGGGALLFHASFDKGVDADLAGGDARGLFNGPANGMKWDRTKDSRGVPLLKRAPGIRGMGLVTGVDGQPAPTSNMLGTRRLLRRIYTLLREKHPDGLIFFHMSGQVNMAIWSFTDALVDGENYASLLDRKENRGYEKVLRLDQFAAEYAAQNNFGPYSVVLPEFSRSGAIRGDEWAKRGYPRAEYLLGLIFLHNSKLWYPADVPLKLTNKIYDAFDSNGLTSKWTYVGYWKQKGASLPADVKASFHVSPDRCKAFMLVMNLREKDLCLDISLHARELGMKGVSRITVLYRTDAPARLRDGAIRGVRIPAKNFRLFLLQQDPG